VITRTRVTIAGAVAALVATASLLGGVLTESSSNAPAAVSPTEVSADLALSGFSLGDTEQVVLSLQLKLRDAPRDARSYALLGLAYEQRARETGDPSFYPRAAGVLRRAVALAPRNELATSGLASLSLSQHRFRDALRLSRRAQALAPSAARNYGLLGDALVELGRYREAFRVFDRMSSLKPNLASYARISYARELLGRQEGAISAMNLAVQAAGEQSEPAAWTHVQLGKLHFGRGEVKLAARQFHRALLARPSYVYAVDALARVEAARGRYRRAIELARQASEAVPLPEFVTTLGDLYWARGNKARAREQYAVVGATERLLRANGVRTDLELALFKIDHGTDLQGGLALARTAYRERPTVFAADTLAWALARTGRCREALPYSSESLRLGTRDATFFFHRGMIERCLGHRAEARTWFARALEQNPNFSLVWAPVALRALR
jgi:tetratricopeptide (TPR) repeat protein